MASSSEVKTLKVVDLPAPFTPSKAKHSPLLSPNESLSTALSGSPGLQGPDPLKYTLRSCLTFIYKLWSGVFATLISSSSTSSSISKFLSS